MYSFMIRKVILYSFFSLFIISALSSAVWISALEVSEPNQSENISQSHLPANQDRSYPLYLGGEQIEVEATAALVLDVKTKKVLYSHNENETRPIASLTKLFSSFLFLEKNPDFNKVIKLEAADQRYGGRLNFPVGEKLTIKDLFFASLVSSDNGAMVALIRSLGAAVPEYVEEMNLMAMQAGLRNTHFLSPTGLDVRNVSTASEIAQFALTAFNNEKIRQALFQTTYQAQGLVSGRNYILKSTNLVLGKDYREFQMEFGKTGYLEEAGYCFITLASDKKGNQILIVVFGALDHFARFEEAKALAKWTFSNYQW